MGLGDNEEDARLPLTPPPFPKARGYCCDEEDSGKDAGLCGTAEWYCNQEESNTRLSLTQSKSVWSNPWGMGTMPKTASKVATDAQLLSVRTHRLILH